MNLVTSGEPWIGSASVSRFHTIARRGILHLSLRRPPPPPRTQGADTGSSAPARAIPLALRLLSLRPVLRPALLAPLDAHRVERAAHHVVAHARQVLHAASADEDDRVLLQV